MIKNSKLYDFLKWFALLGSNSISAFLIYCGQQLNNNAITIIAGIVSALGTCIAGCLGISTVKYNNENGDILGEAQHKIAERQEDYVGEVFDDEIEDDEFGDDEDEGGGNDE